MEETSTSRRKVRQWAPWSLLWWPTSTWSSLRSWHWRRRRPDPGCGRGMLMTLSASSGRAQPKNSYTSQRGQANHQVHCGAGRRWDTPVPRHAIQKERGWQPRHLNLQEAHTHGLVYPLQLPSSDPREERCGEMSPQQGQRDHQHTGQPSEGS